MRLASMKVILNNSSFMLKNLYFPLKLGDFGLLDHVFILSASQSLVQLSHFTSVVFPFVADSVEDSLSVPYLFIESCYLVRLSNLINSGSFRSISAFINAWRRSPSMAESLCLQANCMSLAGIEACNFSLLRRQRFRRPFARSHYLLSVVFLTLLDFKACIGLLSIILERLVASHIKSWNFRRCSSSSTVRAHGCFRRTRRAWHS